MVDLALQLMVLMLIVILPPAARRLAAQPTSTLDVSFTPSLLPCLPPPPTPSWPAPKAPNRYSRRLSGKLAVTALIMLIPC